MIKLTKLDGSPILITLETVKYIEAVADTRVAFLNGDSVFVREDLCEIEEQFVSLQGRIAGRVAAFPLEEHAS